MTYSSRKTASGEAGLRAVASRFGIASQHSLQARSLLSRSDTKFIVPSSLAVWVLARVAENYEIVMHGPSPLAAYVTDYFDTPGLQCFFDDIDGSAPRYKVRVRSYQDGNCFFETKAKNPGGLTCKHRLPRTSQDLQLSIPEKQLIAATTFLDADELTRSISVDYDRLTLISRDTNERVTVDVNIVVRIGETRVRFPEVTIFEAKQDLQSAHTPVVESLRLHGIEECTLSKYCSALALANESLAIGQAAVMLEQLRSAQTIETAPLRSDVQEPAAPLPAMQATS